MRGKPNKVSTFNRRNLLKGASGGSKIVSLTFKRVFGTTSPRKAIDGDALTVITITLSVNVNPVLLCAALVGYTAFLVGASLYVYESISSSGLIEQSVPVLPTPQSINGATNVI